MTLTVHERFNGSWYLALLRLNISHHNETLRSSHRKCSIKNSVLKYFAKFTGKHLRQGLFFEIKLQTEAMAIYISGAHRQLVMYTSLT